MPPILYKIDSSPPARSVLMLADILGLQLELRELNPVLREQDTPEFTMKNPMRTVPILNDGDYTLADSHAINIYLLEKYGKPEHMELYPSETRARSTVHERLFFDCGILFPRLRAIMAPAFMGKLTKLTNYMKHDVNDAYRALNTYLTKTKYLAADAMTLADINAVSTVSSLDGIHPIDDNRYPKLKKWLEVMSQKDFYKKYNEPGCREFITVVKKCMENNWAAKSKL